MPVSRHGTAFMSSSMPTPPLDAISTDDEVRPAAPMSWIATIASDAISSRQASISSFSVNGSPTCTVGRFSSRILGEIGRRHGRAVDAVAPGLGADIDDRIADARGGRIEDLVGLGDADGHRVDQDVAVIGAVEIDLAADRRHADAIAVAADAVRPRPRSGAASSGWSGRPKRSALRLATGRAPIVNTSRRMPPTPGRRALIGLDVAGVVVALHLEDRRLAVADVDHAGILARAADHPRRRRSAASSDGCATDLYEQCSDHITEKMPSSVRFGSRPMRVEDALIFLGATGRARRRFRA